MKSDALVIYAEPDPAAAGVYRRGRVALESRALSVAPPPRCIRVELVYTGVCGTDLHLVQNDAVTGRIKTTCPMNVPPEGRVFGHEGVGRVIAVGADAGAFRPGALVAFESIEVCHRCEPCRRGRFNQCLRSRLLGMEADGLFAAVADVSASLAHDVTDLVRSDADARSLACLEPAAVALVACENARLSPGEEVAIIGAGPIGVFCAMLARECFGAARVHVVEPEAFRREFAAAWADRVWSPEEFFAEGPPGVDVVFEASGHLAGLNRVLTTMRANGRVVLLARGGEPLELRATDAIITRSLSVIGSRGHLGGAFDSLLRLHARGRFDAGRIVTRVEDGLPGLARCLAAPADVPASACKVLARLASPFVG